MRLRFLVKFYSILSMTNVSAIPAFISVVSDCVWTPFKESTITITTLINTYKQYIKQYSRYIDDIFMIWSGDMDTLHAFHMYLNSCVESISFSMETNLHTIHFLSFVPVIRFITVQNTHAQYSGFLSGVIGVISAPLRPYWNGNFLPKLLTPDTHIKGAKQFSEQKRNNRQN